MELPRNVTIISTRVAYKDQVKITKKAAAILRTCRRHNNIDAFTAQLKSYLEERYGMIWHVICTTGSYWMNYAHEGPYTLNFNIDGLQVMAWKTPSNDEMNNSTQY